MPRKWTKAQKRAQAKRIREWQPWKTGGVKTAEGKAVSRLNATKSGMHGEEMKRIRRVFRQCRAGLREMNDQLKNGIE